MRPQESSHEFEIDPAPIWPDEDGHLEPIFLPGPLWIEFEDFDPIEVVLGRPQPEAAGVVPAVIGFEEFAPLDSEPAGDAADEAAERSGPPPPQRASAIGVLGSLGVHLLTLLVLIGWGAAPAEVSGAIAVHLVIEEGSPPNNAAPPGQALAEQTSEPVPSDEVTPPVPPPPAPPLPKLVSAMRPAKPSPPPPPKAIAAAAPAAERKPEAAPKPPPPTPPPPKQVAAAAPAAERKPDPAPKPPPPPPPPPLPAVHVAASTAAPPRPNVPAAGIIAAASAAPIATPRPAAVSGTGHGDYLNQLVVLTRGHLDILPLSFLAGRRGRVTLSVLVIEDGTVGRISVKHSSGYPDIDARIEQMVSAVGRFPPVPAALPHPSVVLDFDMSFPDALQQ